MPLSVLVTGGTGTLGRLVVPKLQAAGCAVRVISRRGRPEQPRVQRLEKGQEGVEFLTGDLDSGEGVDRAFGAAEVVVHCAGSAKGDEVKARQVAAAGARAGVRHLVFISVVGADAIPVESRLDRAMFGYFASKRAAEEVVAGSGLPWTTLRATQFHDLTWTTVRQLGRLPVIPVPTGFRFQPVDTGEVAERLVELTLGAPSGLVPDIAGPKVYPMAELVRGYLRATGRRRPILPVPLPGGAARAVRAGANLNPERAVGRRTWEDFLAAQVAAVRAP